MKPAVQESVQQLSVSRGVQSNLQTVAQQRYATLFSEASRLQHLFAINLRVVFPPPGFSLDKVPQDLDVIVIGSGIGGLTAAATLAKAGKKVLVLEQHDQAGGCCHTYIEKGFEFDVGKSQRLSVQRSVVR